MFKSVILISILTWGIPTVMAVAAKTIDVLEVESDETHYIVKSYNEKYKIDKILAPDWVIRKLENFRPTRKRAYTTIAVPIDAIEGVRSLQAREDI